MFEENDGRGHHWTSQRPPPGLVDAGDKKNALLPQGTLALEGAGHLGERLI